MTTTRTPRATALLDQLRAADDDTRRQLGALADALGGTITATLPTGPARTILRRLAHRIAVHGIGLCAHLDPDAPRPSFWAPWAPGRLRCADCHDRAGARIAGTAEDRICDGCRRPVAAPLRAVATALPPLLVDLPDAPWVLPPVVVTYGLCATCYGASGG